MPGRLLERLPNPSQDAQGGRANPGLEPARRVRVPVGLDRLSRFSLDADGNLTYEHDGRAPHFFTEQLRTVRRLGQPVFLDDQGTEWLLSQLVAKGFKP